MRKKAKAKKKKNIILVLLIIFLLIGVAFYMIKFSDIEIFNFGNNNSTENNNNQEEKEEKDSTNTNSSDNQENSNNQNVIRVPSYANARPTDLTKGNLILVNKENYLPRNFVPSNLINIEPKYGVSGQIKAEVYEAFKEMYVAAELEGLNLFIQSPYRSWDRQNTVFNSFVRRDGVEAAETYSARPGHSEHQTGLAIDIVAGRGGQMRAFVNTMEYSWLVANAHTFGFILRYPNEKTHITGFIYEPWHWRFLGVEMATRVRNSNLTFDEFYARYIR